MSIKLIDQSSIFLIFLLPLALLTGPFLPDLIVSFIAIYFLITIFFDKKRIYINNFLFYFFIIFYLYLIISSLLSDYKLFSLQSSLPYVRYFLFTFAFWYFLNNYQKSFNTLSKIFIITYSLAIILAIYQFIYGQTIFGNEAVNNRLLLPLSDQLLMGQYLSRLFPIVVALVFILKIQRNYKYFIFLLLFVSTDVVVYLSGERTALGLLLIVSVFILCLVNKMRYFRFFTLLLSLLIIILISFVNSDIKKRNIDHTLDQIGISDSSSEIYIFSKEHDSLIKTSWNIFQDNKVFGIGPNNFRNYCNIEKYKINEFSCSTHPHNTFFQILVELGIIGLIFYFVILIYFLKSIFLQIKSQIIDDKYYFSDFQVIILSSATCLLFPILPSLNFFNNWNCIVYFLPLGLFMYSIYKDKT